MTGRAYPKRGATISSATTMVCDSCDRFRVRQRVREPGARFVDPQAFTPWSPCDCSVPGRGVEGEDNNGQFRTGADVAPGPRSATTDLGCGHPARGEG